MTKKLDTIVAEFTKQELFYIKTALENEWIRESKRKNSYACDVIDGATEYLETLLKKKERD